MSIDDENLQLKAVALNELIIRINELIEILEYTIAENEAQTHQKNYPFIYGATRHTLSLIQNLANRIQQQTDSNSSNGSPNANSINPNELPFIDPEQV